MESAKTHFDISQYLSIIVRRKWCFIIPLVVIYSFFLIASFVVPKIYQAQATILVEEKKIVNPLLKDLTVSTSVGSRLNTLREEILAWPRLFQLVERLGLNKNIKNPLELEKLINDIRRHITLKMKSNDVVIIAYQGKDPKSTQKLVNTLTDILIQRNLSLQTEDTESAIDFIKEQLAIYKEKLDKSETALRKFKEVYGLGVLPGLDEASPTGVTLKNINKELSELEAELVMASIDMTDEHPRVKRIKDRIQSLKKKRSQYIKEAAKKIGVKPKAYVDISDSLPRQEEELSRLSRDKEINSKIYAMLKERLETAQITERLDTSENRTKFRVIEPALLPLTHIKPNKLKFNLIGLFLGAMTGFGLVYLLEFMIPSFKSEEELRSAFGYPVLGSIAKIVTEIDMKRKRKGVLKVVQVMGIFIIVSGLTYLFMINKKFILPPIIEFIKKVASYV